MHSIFDPRHIRESAILPKKLPFATTQYTPFPPFQLAHSRRYLLARPIPAPPPTLHPNTPDNLAQPLSRKLCTKQLILPHISLELEAKIRFYSSRMQRQGQGILPAPLLEINIHALRNTIHRGLARAVRVPPSQPIIADRADARGHECHYC